MILGQKILVQLIGDAGISVLGFLTTIFIAKFLGSTVLGSIGFTLGLLGLFASLLDLGFGTTHVRKVAEGGRLAEKMSLYFLISLALSIIYTIVLVIYFLVKSKFGQVFGEVGFTVFLIFYFYLIVQSFSQVFLSTLQGLGEAVKYNLARLTAALTRTALVAAVVLFGFSLIHISLTYFIESIVLLLLSTKLIGQVKFMEPHRQLFKSYVSFTAPLAITTFISYIFVNVDKVMLGTFWDFKTVGIFFGISQLVNFAQQISSSAMTFFYPDITKKFSQGNINQIKKQTFLAIKYLLLIITPILTILAIFRNQFIGLLLGKEFLAGTNIFLIFLILAFWITIMRPYSNILFAAKIHQILPIISLTNLLLIFILDFIFVPKEIFGVRALGLGAMGAALANILVWFYSGSFQILWVIKKLKIGLPKSILIQLFAGVLFYFSAIYVSNYLKSFFGLFFGAVLGFLIYLLVLFFLKEFRRSDLEYFRKVVRFS